jgi:hypothetical protein
MKIFVLICRVSFLFSCRSSNSSDSHTSRIDEFLQYFELISSLGYEDAPDYTQLKNLFKQLFVTKQFTYDNILYDWEILAYQQRSTTLSAIGSSKVLK